MDLHTLCEGLNVFSEYKIFLEKNDISLKEREISTVKGLYQNFCQLASIEDISFYTDYFIFNFQIPQLGEEFDLLRLGDNYNINIELKSIYEYTKIEKQLKRKKHFLKFLEIPSYHLCYSLDNDKFYVLTEENSLKEISSKEVFRLIKEQNFSKYITHKDIEPRFNINNYLISPFNTTQKFLNEEYFLTSHQDLIKKEILEEKIKNKELFMVEGKAGTGKTLLIYDVAKELIKSNSKVVICHCGILNAGHRRLLTEGYKILSPVNFLKEIKVNNNFDLIIIDESQRLRIEQFNEIISFTKKYKISCLFSIDQEQCLHQGEIENNIKEKLSPIITDSYFLNSKIRTNPRLATFIKNTFELNTSNMKLVENNDRLIELKLFREYSTATSFVDLMCKEYGYVHLSYATSNYYQDPLDKISENGRLLTAHKVIGQEFDKVIVSIDNNFRYKTNDKKTKYRLIGNGKSYYHAAKMLFQNMTRTRNKLCIVIIDNDLMFTHLSSLITNN